MAQVQNTVDFLNPEPQDEFVDHITGAHYVFTGRRWVPRPPRAHRPDDDEARGNGGTIQDCY